MQKTSKDKPLTLDSISELARETIIDNGSHGPLLIIEGTAGRLIIPVERLPDTAEGRIQALFRLGRQVKREGNVGTLKQAFFISEAWVSMGADLTRMVVPPSQDPKRKEVLLISHAVIASSTHDVRILEIVRDTAGQVSRVNDLTPSVSEDMRVESPLMQAFVTAYTGD